MCFIYVIHFFFVSFYTFVLLKLREKVDFSLRTCNGIWIGWNIEFDFFFFFNFMQFRGHVKFQVEHTMSHTPLSLRAYYVASMSQREYRNFRRGLWLSMQFFFSILTLSDKVFSFPGIWHATKENFFFFHEAEFHLDFPIKLQILLGRVFFRLRFYACM